MNEKILVIDDNEETLKFVTMVLQPKGYKIATYSEPIDALRAVEKDKFDLILIDFVLPSMDGLEFLEKIRKIDTKVAVAFITAYASVESAVECMKAGALDYITKPFSPEELLIRISKIFSQKAIVEKKQKLEEETDFLKTELKKSYEEDEMIGDDPQILKVYVLVEQLANIDTTVLVTGETGTGKELVARQLHYRGHRKNGPLVKVNCPGLSSGVLESELFGHEKGAYTGAISTRKGRFEYADGGTIILDEISEIPLNIQAKLLHVLDTKTFERVGGNETIQTDVRVVALTNRDLVQAIHNKEFRADLFYRLNVINIKLPPLRDRKSDIPTIVNHYTTHFANLLNKKIKGVTEKAMNFLLDYDWPGNIRELKNVVERAVAIASSDWVTKNELIFFVRGRDNESIKAFSEKDRILQILAECKWHRGETSKKLGMDRSTLWRKMKEYGLA